MQLEPAKSALAKEVFDRVGNWKSYLYRYWGLSTVYWRGVCLGAGKANHDKKYPYVIVNDRDIAICFS